MSLITPKTIVITTYPGTPGSVNASSPKSEISLLDTLDTIDFDSDGGGGGSKKRRRLTHLSPDEKLLRRKLKNRVAAQTARDRKKALMTELEERVAKLVEENKHLRRQNTALKETSNTLVKENTELKSRLSDPSLTSVKTESETSRSAAPVVPLQKEQVQILTQWLAQYWVFVTMLSLMISSACCKKLQVNTNSSSRKRKQTHPHRRVSVEEEQESILKHQVVFQKELILRGDPPEQSPETLHLAWWGSHQRSWNPSMN